MAAPDDSEEPRPVRRRHPGAVYALLVAGTLSAFLAIAAIWVSRQALETDSWTQTSSELLADQEIRTAVSGFLVDRLYAEVDVAGEIGQALPPRAQPLAGPAAGALRDLAERVANEALGRPRVQALWEDANRAAHEQLLRVLEGGGPRVSTEGGTVTLRLDTILKDIAARTGVGGKAVDKIPPDAADIEVLKSDQLKLAQDVADSLKPLALLLTLLALALYGGAIALAGDRRRETLRGAGYGFIVAGLLALVARSLAGDALVDSLASTEAARPAVESVWEIGTSLMVEIATAAVIYGVLIVLAAWLAGPGHAAVGTRRALAPYLRDPRYAWGGVLAIMLIVLWWGPTPGTRRIVPAILLIALFITGVAVLRRLTAREYPDAPEPHPVAGLRRGVARLGSRWDERREARTGSGSSVAALERLADLHDRGALSDEEFAAQKRDVLAAKS